MASVHYLKEFDKRQLFRFFVDGRFHKKYDGWVKYEEREKGSVQAIMNGFAFMMDNLYTQKSGLSAMYILQLHRTCMIHVESNKLNTAPGDIRHLRNSIPFFVKTTTLEHIEEVLEMRMDDGTKVFNDKEIFKTANELNAKDIYKLLQKKLKLSYRPWYPNLDIKTISALEGKETLTDFYNAKHYVQMLTVKKIEEIVKKYNIDINTAKNAEEKLRSIALIVRELELLHSFSDGNCRIYACVLLNQLLIYNSFPPSMTYNPNLDGEYSLSQWIEEIKKGMEQTKVLLKNPNAEVYNYSIDYMSEENQNKFLNMASSFIKKIEEYKEIYITPIKIQKYTKGTWFNYEKNLCFNGVGNSSGNIAFFTAAKDLLKSNKSIIKELKKMIKNGVRAIVVDDHKYIDNLKLPMILVDDIFVAYENVSKNVRQDINPKTILITGTEGKTGTKIQIHHLFSKQINTHAILNSANAKVPVLKTMASLEKNHKCEIVEFSVDAYEEKTIKGAKIVNPDICFFTNIGKEHMHNHKSINGVIKAKSAVIEGMRSDGICIVNSSIESYDDFVFALKNRKRDINIITYGMKNTDTAHILESTFDTETLAWNIRADIDGIIVDYSLPFIQSHAPLMSVGVLLSVKIAGLDVLKAAKDYSTVKPYSSMGLIHKIPKESGSFLFYDQSRRASISGVRSAFKDLNNFKIKGKIVALIGSISSVNANEWTESYHAELAELINENKYISKLYTTGPNMESTHNNLKNKKILILHSDNYQELYKFISSDLKAGDLLFVMGYMRLYLDKFSEMILNTKFVNPFNSRISDFGLSEDMIMKYKTLIISSELENNTSPYIISNNSNIDIKAIENIKNNGLTFKEQRANLLFNFFKELDILLEKKYNMEVINNNFLSTNDENFIYNKVYCNLWYNNFNKINSEPRKQLFGSFYKINRFEDYFFFIIVGTVNMHIGIGRYKNNEILTLDNNDQKKINKLFGSKLPSSIVFKARNWGKKWLTVDIGSFIDIQKEEIFSTIVNLEKSDFYKKKLEPFLKILS